MLRLERALHAWGTSEFEILLKQELLQQASELPLQQGLTQANYVADTPITTMIQHIDDNGDAIHLRIGIFYQGVIGGCSCADDPPPASETTEYCEVALVIDRASASATVSLLPE